MNTLFKSFFTFFIAIVTFSCSYANQDTSNDKNSYKQYLAKNIQFNTANASYLPFKSSGKANKTIDTETQIMASNVLLENTKNTVNSDNVQDAFDEVLPEISDIIGGIWNARSYNNGATGETGNITFNKDGTFTINSGVLTIIGGCSLGSCSSNTGNWELVDNTLLKLTLDGESPQFPFIINYSSNKMTMIRASNITIIERSTD